MVDTKLLLTLLSIDSPVGDEYRMADWLTEWIAREVPEAAVARLRDCLIVTKGIRPSLALFAHIDTIGYTIAPNRAIYPLGHPATPRSGARVRGIGMPSVMSGTLSKRKSGEWKVRESSFQPGERIVSAEPAIIDVEAGTITSPYLDNRGGIYAALKAMQAASEIAVAFTTGEETGASGARLCARYLWEQHTIARAIVSDITWHTEFVKCGDGVAISRRDTLIPSQRYVDQVIRLAEQSGIEYQIEIESSGGSDGAGIEASGCPIDWVFVGAPEKRPHTPTEELRLSDLDGMARLLAYLSDALGNQKNA